MSDVTIMVGNVPVTYSTRKGVIPVMMNATHKRYSHKVIAAFITSECYRKDSDRLNRLVKRAKVIARVERAFEKGQTTHLCVSDRGLMALRDEYVRAVTEYAGVSPMGAIVIDYDGRQTRYDIEYMTFSLIGAIVEGRLKLN